MLIRNVLKSKLKKKHEAPQVAMTSTPNASGEVAAITPDVSIIEGTCSSPVLISAESMEDLEIEFFDRMRVSALHPGSRIVQRAAHNIISPNTAAQQKTKEKSDTMSNNLSYLQHLATELQKSALTLSKMQIKNSTLNLREPSEETNQSSFTKSCGEVAAKLNKCSSPFREHFSLQTFRTTARQTSPIQTTDAGYKATATQPCPRSVAHSNLGVIFPEHRPLRPIPSLSCPSTPRESRRAYANNAQSRSQSPFPGPDLNSENQRRKNTLKDIIHKITTIGTFSDAEPNRPQISRAESSSPNRAGRGTPPRYVHFTPRPASAGACPVREDVQELYFNRGMKNACKPCTQSFESPDSQPWMRKDTEKNPCQSSSQTGTCPAACRCKPRQSTPPTTPSIQAVTMRCSSCQLPKPPTLADCQMPPPCAPPRQAQSCYPRGRSQSPCKTDTGLSGTESLCSVNSTSGMSDAKRAQYLQNKLHAVQLCLKNKEETVRVQAESLTCAEQRIALLTVRAAQQRRELETVQRELIKLKGGTFNTKDGCCQASSTRNDACCSTLANPCLRAERGIQLEANAEVENQKNMVVTLQNNLSIIEELYRECFYETVKQEELIENLRKSYLDVRLMEKEKADRIGRLENVVNTQKWSLKTCQDVALEVENLKLEILNFLNNSNNDSGMWEQSVVGEVGEDINDIMMQLHQLREILQEECIDSCTLKRENKNLRELNQGLECKISNLCEQKTKLECTIKEKDDTINCLRREKDELCCEMRGLRCELEAAKKRICEVQNETGCVRKQLTQAQEEVGEVNAEICRLQTCNEELTCKNKKLSEDLERADDIIKENCKIRSEVSYLTQQVALWRQQLAESEGRVHCVEAELARARSHCRNVDQCYREKVDAVAALEVQLQQAHSRGAQLCAESRRVVATVRKWIHRMQDTNAEQCQKIKAQQSFIGMLQKALQERMAEDHAQKCSPPLPPDNPFPRESEDTREFTIETVPCSNLENNAAQDLDDLVQESCDYYSNYRAQLQSQTPFVGVGCSKCAAKRPADPSRSPTDDSDDVVRVGCTKTALPPKRKSSAKGLRSEITIDFQIGCSKCAPKRKNKARKDTNEETESGSGRSQATSTAKSCGCERDDRANQMSCAHGCSAEASCSHIPLPTRRLLRKKLCQDRVAHYLYMQRCIAAPTRSAGVQEPARRDSGTQPCASPSPERRVSRQATRIPMPRAVSPTGELLERVSRLSDAMEESQRRWSRSKISQQHR